MTLGLCVNYNQFYVYIEFFFLLFLCKLITICLQGTNCAQKRAYNYVCIFECVNVIVDMCAYVYVGGRAVHLFPCASLFRRSENTSKQL